MPADNKLSTTSRQTSSSTISGVVALLAISLAALNLRPAIASISPVIEPIRADLVLSYTAVSFLTTIPVFCMGLFAFVTPRVSQYGRERVLFWSIIILGVATAARIGGGNAFILFTTTIVVGITIAIAQTLLPALVGEYFPERTAFATGIYSISLALGATIASALTAPIYNAVGSWPISLASWALLAVAAALVLLPLTKSSESHSRETMESNQSQLPWKSPLAWMVTLFTAGTSAIFYSGLTWLAPRYVALGWNETTAGFLLTVYTLTQVIGMGLFSLFGDRFNDRRPWIWFMGLITSASLVVIAIEPEFYPWLVVTLFGAGSGGMFAIALVLPVEFASDNQATDRLATMAMGIGYMIAAIGPSLVGGFRDLVGGYAPAFVTLCIVSVVTIGFGHLLRPAKQGTVR